MGAISGFHNASSARSAPMFVLDRGPARHFFGRNTERAIFSDVRNDAVASCAGTTFLIQGAPGAGKTALLHKLAEDATADGWQVFHIKRGGLTEPDELARQLGVDYECRDQSPCYGQRKTCVGWKDPDPCRRANLDGNNGIGC